MGWVAPTDYILKKKTIEYKVQIKETKKMKKNYTRASSHSDIGDLYLAFALRITKANSLLKC